jgi:hypothetical protein
MPTNESIEALFAQPLQEGPINFRDSLFGGTSPALSLLGYVRE